MGNMADGWENDAGGSGRLDDGIWIGIVAGVRSDEENWAEFIDWGWVCDRSRGFSLNELVTLDDGEITEEWKPFCAKKKNEICFVEYFLYLNFAIPMNFRY